MNIVIHKYFDSANILFDLSPTNIGEVLFSVTKVSENVWGFALICWCGIYNFPSLSRYHLIRHITLCYCIMVSDIAVDHQDWSTSAVREGREVGLFNLEKRRLENISIPKEKRMEPDFFFQSCPVRSNGINWNRQDSIWT